MNPTPLSHLCPGRVVFAKFKLENVVGVGGMGVVWRAFDEELGHEIALKFLSDEWQHDSSALDDLKRETRRGMTMAHPGIVRVYGYHAAEGMAAVSMELVHGHNLNQLRAQAGVPFLECADLSEWLTQLCDALEYAHFEAGLVHRDLKPSNLMVDARGRLKIADFGISAGITRWSKLPTAESMLMSTGTTPYISPQQLVGEHTDISHDIYGLGATLYDLLSGKPPFFKGNIDAQVLDHIPPSIARRREELWERAGDPVPSAWEEVIAACLAKTPEKRPRTTREIAQRLALRPSLFVSNPPINVVVPGASPPPAAVTTSASVGTAAIENGSASATGPGPATATGGAPGAVSLAMAPLASPGSPSSRHSAAAHAPSAPAVVGAASVQAKDNTQIQNTTYRVSAARRPLLIALSVLLLVNGFFAYDFFWRGKASAAQVSPAQPAPTRAGVAVAVDVSSTVTRSTPPGAVSGGPGFLSFELEPRGATVTFNGAVLSSTDAPRNQAELPPQSGLLRISKSGYLTLERTLTIEPDLTTSLGRLQLAVATGALELESRPAGLPYVLESQSLSAAELEPVRKEGQTPFRSPALPWGDYTVTVRDRTGQSQVQRLTISAAATAQIRVVFPRGVLDLMAFPPGLTVHLDGRIAGETPGRFSLPAATVLLQLRSATGLFDERKVEIVADQTTTLTPSSAIRSLDKTAR